jgi:hypothetical protein
MRLNRCNAITAYKGVWRPPANRYVSDHSPVRPCIWGLSMNRCYTPLSCGMLMFDGYWD